MIQNSYNNNYEEILFLTFEYFLSLVSDFFLSKLPWYQVCPTGEPCGMDRGGRLGIIGASSGVCMNLWYSPLT